MSDFGFDGMMSMKIAKLIGSTQDSIIGNAAQDKDTLMGRTYKIQKAVDAIQTAQGESGGGNVTFLIDFLLSDEDDKIEWAFRQNDIGKALDSLGNFHSSALSACHSVNEIANNATLIKMIGANAKATSICAKNTTRCSKLVNYLSVEDLLYYGYGYSKYSVGDTITLKYYGKDRVFRVVAKDHFTTGKIVLCAEYIEETKIWNDSNMNNYSSSTIREYLNSYVLAGFSNKIQSAITTPSVPCHNQATATTCCDKIWLLSTVEVGFPADTQYAPSAGKAMPWFNSNERRIKKINNANGSAQYWWLRTPYSNVTNRVWIVANSSGTSNSGAASNSGVAFAFEI